MDLGTVNGACDTGTHVWKDNLFLLLCSFLSRSEVPRHLSHVCGGKTLGCQD